MNAHDLTLNIAINLGRLSKWAMEGKKERVTQFISDTESYMNQLEKVPQSEKFKPTFVSFKDKFKELKNKEPDEVWVEDALTWANILTHRARLAEAPAKRAKLA